jgi:hypothetical protein
MKHLRAGVARPEAAAIVQCPDEERLMKKVIAGCLMMMLCAGAGAGAATQSGAKDEAKKAGSAVKDAGKDTGDAAKHAGKATAKATKKTAKTVKKAVTGDAHATCVDGTVQAAKTEEIAAAACVEHGGARK